MNKTAKQAADAFSIPAFDAAAMSDHVREFAEKGVAQSKEAYTKIQDQTEVAQKALETTFEIAHSNAAALSLKTLAALRANSEASFTHIEALIGVKSFDEVIELQNGFARKQAEALIGQVKEFQVVALKSLEEVFAPVKSAVEKGLKDTNPIWT